MLISRLQLLLLAAVLLTCARTQDLLQPEVTNVQKSLTKLRSIDKELNEKLENASIETDRFLFSRNESSAHKTIDIVKDYIRRREVFIEEIQVLNANIDKQGLGQKFWFLDEATWEQELNQTKNELFKLEQVLKLYNTVRKLNEMNEDAYNITSLYIEEGKRRHLVNATNLIRELVDGIRDFIREVYKVRNFTISHHLTGVFTNAWVDRLLDVQYWESLLKNKTEDMLALEEITLGVVINKYARPSLYVVIFVIGVAENGVLIAIFARYPKIRKYRNMIILNLSMSDTLSLLINLPVNHLYQTVTSWQTSPATAQAFMFYRFLSFGLSVFSTVALSLQRYSTTLKLTARTGSIFRQSTKHNCLILIAAVWLLSTIFALPHALYGCIYFKECYNNDVETHSKIASAIFMIDLISLSVIPVIGITTFYWFTVRHLKQRALKLPVDMPEHQRAYQRNVLQRSKNVIVLTPIVFALTSLPYYFYITIDAFLGTNINSVAYTISNGVLYGLMFVNCSFNPIALYVTSGTFRRCIKMNFFWCKRRKNKDKKQPPTNRGLSNADYSTIDTQL